MKTMEIIFLCLQTVMIPLMAYNSYEIKTLTNQVAVISERILNIRHDPYTGKDAQLDRVINSKRFESVEKRVTMIESKIMEGQ